MMTRMTDNDEKEVTMMTDKQQQPTMTIVSKEVADDDD
jgi:hypothetical protein